MIEKDEDTGIVICEVNLIDEFSSEPLNSTRRRKEEKVCSSSVVPKTSFDPSISIASESIIEESENEEWDINTSSCDNTREYYTIISNHHN